MEEEASARGPLTLPSRKLDKKETAYRLVLETSGERDVFKSDEDRRKDPSRDSHLLELEYRAAGLDTEAITGQRLILDALHYKRLERNPDRSREVEAGSDRLRLFHTEEQVADIEGSAPKEALTPRKMLYRPFALVSFNERGEINQYQAQGLRSIRRFLREMPIRQSILYAGVPLPSGAVKPGDVWKSRRFPPNLAGALGLGIEIEYSLAGYADIDGVPCAWLLLKAEENGEGIPSSAGFEFDRVVATLDGEAWIELATSRVRRLVVEDVLRASYQQGKDPAPVTIHRMRYRTRMFLEQRDPGDVPTKWEDGTERFEIR